MLLENNPNHIPPRLRGTISRSQLYGGVHNLVRAVDPEQFRSENGAKAIVDSIYKRDPLSVVSEVYSDFMSLMNAREAFNESFDTRLRLFLMH